MSTSDSQVLPQCNDNGVCEKDEGSCFDCRLCGNGIIDAGESCDDKNTDNDDDCVDNCQPATCGDNHVRSNPANPQDEEACDDGVRNVSSSMYSFHPRCVADPAKPAEQCKALAPHCGDGGTCTADDVAAQCLPDCPSGGCGDGMLDPGEVCDSAVDTPDCNGAGASGTKGTVECRSPVCGDGWHNEAAEACDDSNFDNTDGCVGACQIALCGDGFVQAGVEQCDDLAQPDKCVDCVLIRRVFVTKSSYTAAQIGGLSGADAKCNADAEAKGLTGRFRAWLSDSTGSPSSRFDTSFKGSYRLVNDKVVADGWDGLTSQPLQAPINIDVGGNTKNGSVWTNTKPTGVIDSPANHCTNWTVNGGTSNIGDSTQKDNRWTMSDSGENCNGGALLYCFEDR